MSAPLLFLFSRILRGFFDLSLRRSLVGVGTFSFGGVWQEAEERRYSVTTSGIPFPSFSSDLFEGSNCLCIYKQSLLPLPLPSVMIYIMPLVNKTSQLGGGMGGWWVEGWRMMDWVCGWRDKPKSSWGMEWIWIKTHDCACLYPRDITDEYHIES